MERKLKELIKSLSHIQIIGDKDIHINKLCFDSRKVESGDVFIAQKGYLVDGHTFITKALDKGARVIVCQNVPLKRREGVCYIMVENANVALAQLSDSYYNSPSKKLKLVGVTGTNGKTTIATLLFNSFKLLGYKVGLLSTVCNYINDEEIHSTHTTPDSLQINSLLNQMLEQGCEYCFMEVSSHAIDQDRVSALDFDGGIFTNLTHDHLDYHKTFKSYLNAKKKFFDSLGTDSFVLTNLDDKNGKIMTQNTKAKVYDYSIRALADYKCMILEKHFDGMLLSFDGLETWAQLIGDFNANNLLAVYGTALLLGESKEDALRVISQLKSVDGRFESIISPDGIMAIVDYAHTPDALKNVLETIEQIRTQKEQVITVVGAGGDRDKTKRPLMAQVSCNYSDKVILTSDNPRSEKPLTE